MRVLVVPKWYPWPELPVFGLFCREHARAISCGHDVVVLASLFTPSPDFRVFELTDSVEDGLRTLRVRYRRPRVRPLALLCQLVGMLAAVRRLRREGWKPDIVHAHVYSAALPALVIGRLQRAGVVVTEHYTGFVRGLITGSERQLARVAFERANLVAPVSDDLGRHLRLIAPNARMLTVPNVVDTDVFVPRDEPHRHEPPALLSVGALASKKGHVHLLDALARIDKASLKVIGDGELRGELEAHARTIGVSDRVEFVGEQSKEEVAASMRDADLFVLPSLSETFGCVLIEAMASGVPSVATRVGGVPEALPPAAGTLVAPADPDALAEAINSTLAKTYDPAALAALARERNGYETFLARWTEIYADVLSRRGKSSLATVRRTSSSV